MPYILINKPTGRCYVSSQAKCVDPFDPLYAKVFPTIRSAKQAKQWFDPALIDTTDRNPDNWIIEEWDPAIFEAEISITVGKEVE